MKKTLKVLGLLLVAAALFTGCKKDTDDGPRDIAAPLFDETALTETATKVELKNAKWNIRRVKIEEEEGMTEKAGSEITCSITSSGRVDDSADFDFVMTDIIEYTVDIPAQYKAYFESEGYEVNGKTASACWEMNKAKLAELFEKYPTEADADESDPDVLAYYQFHEFCHKIEYRESSTYYFDSIKTNEDKSKYYAEEDDGEKKWYFSKVQ